MPKKTSDDLNNWNRRIDIAREYRQQYSPDWVYWEKLYNDQLWGSKGHTSGYRKSSVNEIGYYPQVNELETIVLNILPSIIFYEPIFEFTPTHSAWDWSAAVWEIFASYLYNLLEFDETIEEISMDGLILGSGIHKSGYAYEVADTSYQLGDATAGDPEIRNEMVFSNWVSPLDLLIDSGPKRWKDLRWIAQEVRKPLDEVKRNKIYSNTSSLVGTESSIDGVLGVQASRQNRYKDTRNDTVLLIEIHDLENSKIITIADKHEKFLRQDDDYGIELYDILNFQPSRPSKVWGKSISQSIEEHMVGIAKVMYYMDSHARRAGLTKMAFDPAKVGKVAQEALKSSKDFELVPIEGLGDGVSVEEIKGAPVSFDFYQNYNIKESVIRMLSGVTMQDRGRHEPGVETAFEAAALQEKSDARNLQRGKKLNKFIASTMNKMLTIVSDTWPNEKILERIGIPPELSWQLLPFSNIKVDIKFGSTAMAARDDELRKVTMLANLLGQSGIQVNPEGFVKLISNSLGLDFRQTQLLLQPSPQAAQQGGGGSAAQGGQQGGTGNQIMGQLNASRGG